MTSFFAFSESASATIWSERATPVASWILRSCVTGWVRAVTFRKNDEEACPVERAVMGRTPRPGMETAARSVEDPYDYLHGIFDHLSRDKKGDLDGRIG